MASLVFGMHVSLDGYVDHTAFAPPPGLFRPPATPAVQREQGRCRDPPGVQLTVVARPWPAVVSIQRRGSYVS